MVGTTTILAVDDEPGLAELYEAWLGRSYAVRTATGGAAALRAVDEEVDAILLDRQMPDVSGDEALQKLRSQGYDCPVALVTAAKPTADVLELPYDEYMLKPVDRDGILACVDRLLALGDVDAAIRTCVQVVSTATVLRDRFNAEIPENQHLLDQCERKFERAAGRWPLASREVFDEERFPDPPWTTPNSGDPLGE